MRRKHLPNFEFIVKSYLYVDYSLCSHYTDKLCACTKTIPDRDFCLSDIEAISVTARSKLAVPRLESHISHGCSYYTDSFSKSYRYINTTFTFSMAFEVLWSNVRHKTTIPPRHHVIRPWKVFGFAFSSAVFSLRLDMVGKLKNKNLSRVNHRRLNVHGAAQCLDMLMFKGAFKRICRLWSL